MGCLVFPSPVYLRTTNRFRFQGSLVASHSYELRQNNRRGSSCRFRCYSLPEEVDSTNNNGSLVDGPDKLAAAPFKTFDAEITQETSDFFVSDAEEDPDRPSPGFSSIDSAIKALQMGKFVIVVDEENGDEGDLVFAATLVSPKIVAFMMKHGSGIVSVGMKEEDLVKLQLPMVSPLSEMEGLYVTDSAVTVDVIVGTSNGISAADRAKTISALASPESKANDFRRPGHVFPLKYRNGGVLQRSGHTEASVDLVSLARLYPVSVLTTIMDPEDGSPSSLPTLKTMAEEHNLPIICITDLMRYRRKREKLVARVAVTRLPTKWGVFKAYCYRSKIEGMEHVAIVKGDIGDGQDVLVRVHSECLTGDIFASTRCDCGNQLALAMQLIEKEGRGIIIYLRGHEGRGIGLAHKLLAYSLQDLGHDTVEANLELGLAVDAREYGVGAQMLRDLGVRTMRLMTNNPAKFKGLKGYGLAMVGRVPVISPVTEENRRYLETKRIKMGHVYGSDLPGIITGLTKPGDEKAD